MSACRIAVLSGKGGAGKTTVAVRLAQAASSSQRIWLLDADAEEPNAALLLRPVLGDSHPIEAEVAMIDPDLCTGCGECVERCAFQALSLIAGKAKVIESLCHGCGLCVRLCTRHAIRTQSRRIGAMVRGKSAEGISFLEGRLDVGQPRATEVIKASLDALIENEDAVVDGPPGCACSAMLVARRANRCLLVAQPTPMGVHDLELAMEMLARLSIPTGIVINRSTVRGDALVERLAQAKGVAILGRIPEDPRIADASLSLERTGHGELFGGLWRALKEMEA
jgi:MinD superfamily P-loop ATPase